MNRRLALIGGAVLAVAVLAGVWFLHVRPLPVSVATVRVGPAAELVYATGFVEARQPVSVAARITAPVLKVLVAEGERVRRGQALVILSDDEQRALLDQAQAQRRSAEQVEWRTLALFRDGWVTKAARDAAVAEADAARAGQRTASARLDQLVVRAEIDGQVTRRDVEPGELATPTRVLMLLGDPLRIRITATVDERDIARIQLGAPALMSSDAWPGRAIHAHVAEITPGGDPNARAFRVRLLPDEALELPLGMTLEVNVITRRDDRALLVPSGAISQGRVWTVVDGRAHLVAVRTGIAGTDTVQVVAGLGAGQAVIVNPPAGLVEGKRVAAQLPVRSGK